MITYRAESLHIEWTIERKNKTKNCKSELNSKFAFNDEIYCHKILNFRNIANFIISVKKADILLRVFRRPVDGRTING